MPGFLCAQCDLCKKIMAVHVVEGRSIIVCIPPEDRTLRIEWERQHDLTSRQEVGRA